MVNLVGRMLESIDSDAIRAAGDRYKDFVLHKFFDVNRFVGPAAERAMNLGLDRQPPKRILDIGCGLGYFMVAARCLGHDDVVGLTNVFPEEVVQAIGMEPIDWCCTDREPLPPDIGLFDLIVCDGMLPMRYFGTHGILRYEDATYHSAMLRGWQDALEVDGHIDIIINRGNMTAAISAIEGFPRHEKIGENHFKLFARQPETLDKSP